MLHHLVGTLSDERVEEIRGEPKLGIALHDVEAFAQPVEGRHDGGGLGHQPHRLAVVGVGRHVLRLGIVQAQHGNRRAQNIHGSAAGDAPQEVDHGAGQPPLRGQIRLQLGQLARLGQPSIPEKEDSFLEDGVVRQGMNVIAAVAENTQVSVDVANLGFACDDAF